MDKTITKFGDTGISDKVSFDEKGFKYFIGYKDAKKLDLYAYFFQTLVHIEQTLIKDVELLEF